MCGWNVSFTSIGLRFDPCFQYFDEDVARGVSAATLSFRQCHVGSFFYFPRVPLVSPPMDPVFLSAHHVGGKSWSFLSRLIESDTDVTRRKASCPDLQHSLCMTGCSQM